MSITEYITKNALVMIPVLMIVGEIVKGIRVIDDRWIPLILLPVGVLGAALLGGFNAEAIVQGVLVTGAAVYADQIEKQVFKF
ncbi:MAG: phage holin family protein [Clostridia bacterium]|nr:phage holin family protein [Clostridia bacterium]